VAIFKCKMCGGDLEINESLTVGTCQYCGSTMTLPKDTDEKKANLFNRANHYRRNNDFDKAMAAYENILYEDSGNAEAHWGVVLCKYGMRNDMLPTGFAMKNEDRYSKSWNYQIIDERLIAYKHGKISTIQVQFIEKNLERSFHNLKK